MYRKYFYSTPHITEILFLLFIYFTITIIYIDKFMTKYSTELSEVYVRNHGTAP